MEGPLISTRDQLSALREVPEFRRIFLARLISNFGNGMSPIALAFGVLELPGGDAGSLSIVTGAHMVPLVLFMVIGGVAADRFGRARLVGGTDLIGAVIVSVSAVALITHHASVPLLAFNAFLFGILNALWWPAFSGLMPQVVANEHLQSANAIVGMGANMALLLGSAVAGVIVASVGSGWAILIDAASFFVAGLLIFSIRHLDRDAPAPDEQESMVRQLRDGWREFVSRRWLVVVVAGFAFFHMAFEGFIGVIAPVQVKQALGGARDMGWMMAGWGLGGLLGTLVAFRVRVRRPLFLACAVMPVISLWMFALAVPVPIWLLIIVAVASGMAIDIFYATWMTVMQTNIPEEVRSRVSAYDAFGSLVFAPVGLFLAGPFTHAAGPRTALITSGTVALVATGSTLMSRSVRTLPRRDTDEAAS